MIPAAPNRNRAKYLLVVLLLASLLAGCRANLESTQPVQSEFIPLGNEQILGQSFTSHFNGLAAVGLIINPESASRGAIRFSLFEAPGQEPALRQNMSRQHKRPCRLPALRFGPLGKIGMICGNQI